MMTKEELQDAYDQSSALCARLTEACKTLAAERDEARKQRDVLNSAAQSMVDWFDKMDIKTHEAMADNSIWDPTIWRGLDEGFDINILRRAIVSNESLNRIGIMESIVGMALIRQKCICAEVFCEHSIELGRLLDTYRSSVEKSDTNTSHKK